ncbi:GGDEF domain-containing protein, partial [Blastococcus sp. CT_GayMR20]
MSPGPARRAPDASSGDLSAVLLRLLSASVREESATLLPLLEEATAAFAESTAPQWTTWRHSLAARRAVIDNDAEAAAAAASSARESLDKCEPSIDTALAMAYLGHVEVAADHFDAAMLLAVDASLLTEAPAASPSWELLQAHRWLALTLAGLDLEELAVAHAMRGQHVAAALRKPADQWGMRLLSAQMHTELAQTLRRRGDLTRSRLLAVEAIACAISARDLGWEPEQAEADLLDVVQAWALTCSDELEDALGPLRRVRRRVEAEGSLWLRAYTGLALARLLSRIAQRDDDAATGEEAIGLLVEAAGAFVASGDRRRYR